MKKSLYVLLCLLLGFQSAWSQIRSKVDERFELTSIVFRLAGMPEYNNCSMLSYAEDIDNYFAPYSTHELFGFIRELRTESAVGYNAVASTAAMLEISNGVIRLRPEFSLADVSLRDCRWSEKQFSDYLYLLNRFYKKSKFSDFFRKHIETYAHIEKKMDALLVHLNRDWFTAFFGKPFKDDIKIFLSLCNGPNNYAFDEGILVGISVDQGTNEPNFGWTDLKIILHELLHHYTNPIFFSHWPALEQSAEKIYPFVQQKMNKAAYRNAQATFCEWMNELFCIMYFKDNFPDYGFEISWTRMDMDKGFIWMKRSVDFMEHFYTNRNLYPTITDFIPQLAAFLRFTADNMDFVQREYDLRHPYIISIYPALESDISNRDSISVQFSEPMRTDCHGLWYVDNPDIQFLPIFSDKCHWKDDSTFIILFDRQKLEAGKKYGVRLPAKAFRSQKDFPWNDRQNELVFKTSFHTER